MLWQFISIIDVLLCEIERKLTGRSLIYLLTHLTSILSDLYMFFSWTIKRKSYFASNIKREFKPSLNFEAVFKVLVYPFKYI